MTKRRGIGAIVHVLATMVFIVIGTQFAHANEISDHHFAKPANVIMDAAHLHDCSKSGTKSQAHCGAHLLPLAGELEVAASDPPSAHYATPTVFTRHAGPDFDPPPPRS